MKRGPYRVALVLGGLGILAHYLLIPQDWRFVSYDVVEVCIGVSMVGGILHFRPRPARPWWLLATGLGLLIAGDLVFNALTEITGSEVFPSVADALYLASYVALSLGVTDILRSRRHKRDRTALLDALLVTVAAGALTWVYLVDLDMYGDVSLLESLISAAYPVADILLLAFLVRLLVAPHQGSVSERMLGLGIGLLLVADTVYARLVLTESYGIGSWLDVLYQSSYLCIALSALHPSMLRLCDPDPSYTTPSRSRLWLVATIALILPALAAAEVLDDDLDHAFILGATAVLAMFLLTMRTGVLNRTLAAALDREQEALDRERVLRAMGTTLVATPDRHGVCDAAVDHARRLAGADAEAVLFLGDERQLAVAATPQLKVICGRVLHLGDVPANLQAHLTTGRTVVVEPVATGNLLAPFPELPVGQPVVLAPLTSGGRPAGTLLVTVPADRSDHERLPASFEALGSTVSLALEACDLAEKLLDSRSEQRFGALIRHSSDIVVVLRENGTVRFLSPSVTRIMGWDVEALLDRHVAELVHPGDVERLGDALRRLVSHPGAPVPVQYRHRHRNGSWRTLEAFAVNMLEDPAVGGILVNVRDVTDRVRLETSLRASELRLERQVEELQELDRIKGDFVSTASHELRTPLASILGQLELLNDGDLGPLSGDQMRSLGVMERNGRRLLNMIEDLLTLSRVEVTGVQVRPEATDLRALVEDVAAAVRPVAEARPVAFALDIDPALSSADLDRSQIERALLNVVVNAVKFTPPGGSVEFRATAVNGDVTFTVADTGIGIPHDEQDRVFTRFFRSSLATKQAIQGSGLGLVIAKTIVDAHGGTIDVVSSEGEGTVVTVTVPVRARVPATASPPPDKRPVP
ncbi:MAG: sensor histidine kinase [Acidimicrobiales bacterium]